MNRSALDRALSDIAARAELFSHGRRPKFWSDTEVVTFLTERHRTDTLEQVLKACRETFGDARTPSRSALQRYWGRLDGLSRVGGAS